MNRDEIERQVTEHVLELYNHGMRATRVKLGSRQKKVLGKFPRTTIRGQSSTCHINPLTGRPSIVGLDIEWVQEEDCLRVEAERDKSMGSQEVL